MGLARILEDYPYAIARLEVRGQVLEVLGQVVVRRCTAIVPWTNVYGLARSLLALSSLLTLVFNRVDVLFRPVAGVALKSPFCSEPLQKTGMFCVLANHLEVARWVGVALLILVASGWRPRITGILHWWVTVSFQMSASTLEGGDQAAADLTLIMLPVTWTDSRPWHWFNPEIVGEIDTKGAVRRLIALASLLVIRFQVAGIYLHAATGKLKVPEWEDGTAMFYWLSHPVFGVNNHLKWLVIPLMSVPVVVAAVTWGTIVIELFLFAGLVATARVRKYLLLWGLALHLGILVFMGLFTFSITMAAALILYLRPWNDAFAFSFTEVWGGLQDVLARKGTRLAQTSVGDPP